MIQSSRPIAGCMRWGKWGAQYSTREYLNLINACIDQDITCFDHADIYGGYTTEEEFGTAIKLDLSVRKKIQIVTKCGICMVSENRPSYQIKSYDTSAAHIIASAEKSLENFGTDYIDLFLIHRPNPLLDPHEVAEAITKLKQQGKILSFGVSNFLPHQVTKLKKVIDIDYNQVEISILNLAPFTNGILDNCIEYAITPMAWAPLGGGLLDENSHPHFRAIARKSEELAEKYGTGINQILIAWLLNHPSGIIPIVGTTKLERLIQAKQAFNIKISQEDWFALYSASLGDDIP